MKLLVTGGAGFIGSHFVRHSLERWPGCSVTVLDKLTYAGNVSNLAAVWENPRFRFFKGDVCSPEDVEGAIRDQTHVINFAAETHVDRSILDSGEFARTDVEGARVLLEGSRRHSVTRFLQVGTDEVYGDIEPPARANEDTPLRPRSPYSATKAAADLLVGAYVATYGVPAIVTRGSNTYGPNQHPEKLIPLFVTNAMLGLPLPIYGDGEQVREWLHVRDHCSGIATVLERGDPGEIYNLGPGEGRPNRQIIDSIVSLTECDPSLKRHVPDRPGHDRRYALDSARAGRLGWRPEVSFETGLEATVRWYRENRDWWTSARSGRFSRYYEEQYAERLS
jgi:dTDP-glucose 4,6-dehydratase